ncbi:MAG: hypothetical protein IJ532_04700 [Alphaproteobacteria bacterium]|nr:hypothetical protein [Alphaproteobacteria bacterium]
MGKSTNRYTLLRTFGRFVSLIYKSLDAWKITLIYGSVLTFIYYVMASGQFICNRTNALCFLRFQVIVVIVLSLICLCYVFDFYQNAFKNTVFKYSSIIKFDKNKLKSIGFFILYILCFALSAYIARYIIIKPANPDWRIEFVYFFILFIFCMLPVFLMRFSAVVAFYFNEQKLPTIKYLYEKTAGHSYIGIVGFLLTILIMAVFNMQAYGYETHFTAKYPSSVTVEVLTTFFEILVKLFTLNVIFCFFEAQRQLMTENDTTAEKNSEKQAEKSIEKEDKDTIKKVAKKQIKSKKNSRKK